MAINIEAVVGQENMTPAAKERVIQTLAALPTTANTKRFFYARWARVVGIQALPADLDRVARFGDQAPLV